jgi:hypothetical protein
MSNGGIVSLNYSLLETRSDQKMSEFDVPIQAVAIPQSLRMTISKDEAESGPVTARSSGWVGRPLSRCLESKAASMVIMLALMVLAVSGHSVATLTADNAMLAALSICLSIVSISLVVTPTSKEVIVETGFAYTLCIRGHQYTSPDEPVHVMDEDIPQRFINGSDGDVKEARRRWDVTRYWREQEGVNNVLQEPQPHFFIIRSLFPHYVNCLSTMYYKDTHTDENCSMRGAVRMAMLCGSSALVSLTCRRSRLVELPWTRFSDTGSSLPSTSGRSYRRMRSQRASRILISYIFIIKLCICG